MKKKLLTEPEAEQELNRLSEEMKLDDVKFTLALDKDFTRQELLNAAVGAVQRLHAFIDNGHSNEGLSEPFSSVKVF